MRLLRYGPVGSERAGLLDDNGDIRDLSNIAGVIGPEHLSPAKLKPIAALPLRDLPRVSGNPRLGSPYPGVGKFVAVGLNYSDHAAETGMPLPTEPIVFMKATSCIV